MKKTASSMAAERSASSSQMRMPPTMTSRLTTPPRGPALDSVGYPQGQGVQEVLLQVGLDLALDICDIASVTCRPRWASTTTT